MMLRKRALLSLVLGVVNYSSMALTLGQGGFLRSARRTYGGGMLSMMSSVSTSTDSTRSTGAISKGPVPITVLSGFLGAGKTTFLGNTLANRGNNKFGLVVNDMATVNVDAKQIRQQTFDPFGGIDTMELQDGCVCCTLAEDLIASVSKLVSLSELKDSRYDHIVVECSGIAEPRKIRDMFQQAEDYKLELLKKVRLDTLITLVDATVFLNLFGTDADIGSNRKLGYKDVPKDENDPNTYTYLDGSEQRKITDLLLEQVECSDVVLINKCDLLEKASDVDLVKKIISSINPSAKVLSCVNGVLPDPLTLMGSAEAKGAANWGILDEHRNLIKAVESSQVHDHKHAHEHGHDHDRKQVHKSPGKEESCKVEACTDPSHHHHHDHSPSHDHQNHATSKKHSDSHSHDHDHKHKHSHEHNHAETAPCMDTKCTDPTHDHGHSHSHDGHDHHHHDDNCADATCTDPTHNHDHSHVHAHTHGKGEATTAEERFGITSFVYKRRRPFHPVRFSVFLQSLGKLSIKGVSEMSSLVPSTQNRGAATGGATGGARAVSVKEEETLLRAKRALLRSKGFVWMGTSSQAAYFMSHAGQYLDLVVLGRWWAAIDKAEWPSSVQEEITVDFQGTHGDRRQELVFIGQFGKSGGQSQEALEKVLDDCLLSDAEMREYEKVEKRGDDALREHFAPNY